MTKQVQRRRGTATQHTSFTGAEGEISVNTTNKSIHVHDGVTAGGIEGARADMTNVSDGDLNSRLAGNTLSSLTITSADINGGTIDGTVIGGTTPAAGNFTTGSFTGNATFGDNDKAIFGADSDLQIYSDGTNAIIKEDTGGSLYVGGADINLMNPAFTEYYITAVENGAVTLRYDNGPKLATTSTGIDVTGTVIADSANITGTVTADGLTVDNNATHTFVLRRDNSTSPFASIDARSISGATTYYSGTLEHYNGQWRIQTQTTSTTRSPLNRATFDANGDISFYEDTGTTPKMVWSASAESLELTSSIAGAGGWNEALTLSGGYPALAFNETGTSKHSRIGNDANGGLSFFVNGTSSAVGTNAAVIDSSGNVGIGTSSPSTPLHVNGAGTISGITYSTAFVNTSNGTSYFTDASTGNGIYVGGSTGSPANTVRLFTNASEAMRIDSSGNLLVGKTSTSGAVTGLGLYNSGLLEAVADGHIAATLKRLNSDGEILRLRKDGTTVGSIGSYAGAYLTTGTKAAGLAFIDVTTDQYVRPHNTTTNAISDGIVDLGNSAGRFKDLYLSGGVYLGGTGSANKLDDYEEGTWTPTLAGQTTAGSPTYTTREGWYVKVGDMVTVSCAIDLSALGGVAGDLRIKNLPFVASATFTTNSNVGAVRLNNVNSEPDAFCVIVIGGQSEVAMRSVNANSDTNLLGSNLTNTTGLGFQVSYRTA